MTQSELDDVVFIKRGYFSTVSLWSDGLLLKEAKTQSVTIVANNDNNISSQTF